ncbi:SH3 domain-containing protein [Leptolyngbya sp. AN02str]|uniref:SH3 domain-containing protein n=1 Tax=Leptolyngbya sp. AN02str TaxID=3423363 RepID=UPI003D316E08
METLAFTHAAIVYEDPNPAPTIQVSFEIPSSIWLGTLSTAVVASAVLGAAPEAQAVVGRGDVCAAVSSVQTALRNNGYDIGVDGVFGPATESAVAGFQAGRGLSADGTVGPSTAAALSLADPEDSNSPYAIGMDCYGGGSGGGGEPGGNYYVSTNGGALTVRSGPGTGYAAIDYLSNGSYVSVTETYAGWGRISGGGWVSMDWLSSGGSSGGGGIPGDDGAGPDFVTVSTNGGELTVRSGPGTGYGALYYLANGATVQVVGASGGWYNISGGGWISSSWTVEGFGGGGGNPGGGGGGNAVVSTNGGSLAVRSGPSTGYGVLYEVYSGESLNIVETYAGWGRISGGGWVSLDWVYFY